MSDERLSPERAVRLLRAKMHELESYVRNQTEVAPWDLAADIALVAGLLADHIERTQVNHGPTELHPDEFFRHIESGGGPTLSTQDHEALSRRTEGS